MRYINISETNYTVSVICLGTAKLGTDIGKKDSYKLLDTFVEAGGNFIDTAHIYADWISEEKSMSEKTIGAWLKDRNMRDKVIVATKGAHPKFSSMHTPRLSREEITEDLNESLRCLGVDSIDLYYLHRDDRNRPVGEILETLNDKVKEGKIKYFACSNWQVDRIKQAMDYAKEHSIKSFAVSQIMWSFAVPNNGEIKDDTLVIMDKESMEFYKKNKMAVAAYTSQANGFFTKAALNGIDGLSDGVKAVYYNEENIKRLERIKKIAKDYKTTVTAVVLAYITNQSFAGIPVVGCRTVEQLKDSLKAGDLVLTPEIVRYLENGE